MGLKSGPIASAAYARNLSTENPRYATAAAAAAGGHAMINRRSARPHHSPTYRPVSDCFH